MGITFVFTQQNFLEVHPGCVYQKRILFGNRVVTSFFNLVSLHGSLDVFIMHVNVLACV